MTETNTEDRQPARCFFDQIEADSGFVGIAGTWRENNSVGTHLYCLVGAEGIVAPNFDLRSQFAQIVAEVVGETIVIID